MFLVFVAIILLVNATAGISAAQEQRGAVQAQNNVSTINFDGQYCRLRVDNPHYSDRYNDVSVHSTVSCYFADNGRRYYTERLALTTDLTSFFAGIPGEAQLNHCSDSVSSKFSFTLPCHGPYMGATRFYKAVTDATVTINGVTKSVEATNVGP